MALLQLICGYLKKYQKKKIEVVIKSNKNFAQTFVDHHVWWDVNFNGHCLINDNISRISKIDINLYIFYTLNQWWRNLNTDFTLRNCLFGSVKLAKNADPDKHKYKA